MLLLGVVTALLAGNALCDMRHSPMAFVRQLGDQLSRSADAAGLESLYPTRNLSVPVDHFQSDPQYEPHSDANFSLRYWFDDTYYKPGGPVFVLAGGETDASSRLPYLQKGILYILSKATGGLGVVLEHRYYGASFPVQNLSIENLRFLTTDQALADAAYFAQNVVFAGHEDEDLTANATPWIAYGGSYAGAFVAFLRQSYPDIFWGAISSSGVTKAIYNYWEYYDTIRTFGPQKCMQLTQYLVNIVDRILLGKESMIPKLKSAFGLSGITHNDDFAAALSVPLQYFQGLNWDPAVNEVGFYPYCYNLTSSTLIWQNESSQRGLAESFIKAAGYNDMVDQLTLPMLNFFGFIKYFVADRCGADKDACFGTHNSAPYKNTNLSNYELLSWPWQYCTEWGFLPTADVPNGLPVVSQLQTLQYSSLVCQLAFNRTDPPDVEIVNKRGGFDIAQDRLAIIDGRLDPWRPATPHAPAARPWGRQNTLTRPFFIISDGVHHWDENGVFPNQTFDTFPPQPVANAHDTEVKFVTAWLAQADGVFPKDGTKAKQTT